MNTKNLNIKNLPSLESIRQEIDRRACKKLSEFFKRAWAILEPSTPLVWGKLLDILCDELEQVYFNPGFQPRLLINVPPGFSKSLLTSVFFPAWVWTLDPSKSFTGAAHEQGLAIRDARKMRILVESDWYQARWPLKMASDQNAKTSFENEKLGFRQAVPFKSLTGRRSDFVIIDDPLSAEDANSEAALIESERLFKETLPTRVNNDQSAIIIIMQRLHERDPSGLILGHPEKYGYKTLIFPMRYDPARANERDWRTVDGELLFPERFNEAAVSKLEEILGSYAAAGQLDQSPVPRGGGLFNREWLKKLDAIPNNITWVRGWDLAATTNATSAYTAGVKLGKTPDGKIVIGHVVRGRWTPEGVYRTINETADIDGISTRISIPTDPGQAGIAQKRQFATNLEGYDVRFSPETGDKVTRALPLSAQAEAGNFYYLAGEWNQAYIDELATFPTGKWKDQVDATSRAYAELLKMLQHASTVSTFGPKVY